VRQINLIVLAGGLGTRLRTAVPDAPKPLAPILDRPFLGYLIESWIDQGITTLTFLLNHQADLIEAFLNSLQSNGRFGKCAFRTIIEPNPMGTGGAVAHAVRRLRMSGPFMVTNADTWLGSGIKRVFDAPVPGMAVIQVANSERYGSVRIKGDKVVEFVEKQKSLGGGWVNAGLYHLQSDTFQNWDGLPFSLEHDLFPKLVASGQVHAVPLETDFIDIGIPEDYLRFCRWVESGQIGVL
jgi:D-glycero-alpha-D-manno-heptose 1-phosphate guanylyltransferase